MAKATEQLSPLGKISPYVEQYDPSLLFPIPRKEKRSELGIALPVPFSGADIWNSYELSWLGPRGKPAIAVAEFRIPAHTPNLIESKSLKLYLNSFNQTVVGSMNELANTIARDVGKAVGGTIDVTVQPPYALESAPFAGENIDSLQVTIDSYEVTPSCLVADDNIIVEEILCSDLLKSNCLVTGQPDWASLQIHYRGPRIDRSGLLKYIISYRRHWGFAEHCVEQIFVDLSRRCETEKLSVYARYTRRGGIDINPFRSNWEEPPSNTRITRQ